MDFENICHNVSVGRKPNTLIQVYIFAIKLEPTDDI